jgi:hypothetical protein
MRYFQTNSKVIDFAYTGVTHRPIDGSPLYMKNRKIFRYCVVALLLRCRVALLLRCKVNNNNNKVIIRACGALRARGKKIISVLVENNVFYSPSITPLPSTAQ